ncbi:hypothetical protein GTR04_1662 [Trichophyton interdigitale]|uniref:Zn(2)-C6 fungal-type domain-containing protein n=1 Tax=Trichophyton interdigitale TaxID=101480 RepID=A0A9P4YLS3_9EURO|nr:hypothetical protein GY631_1468 [Trichophyton interdigitale]KAF3899558.1 hypothetical protein GY632_1258 [Trichophyton interdigitale]KAG8210952.1 hypothetical protein GTR04_1662 [Trichophyton interdigitale]
MHIPKAWKAVFVLLNHGFMLFSPAIAAGTIPPLAAKNSLVFGPAMDGIQEPASVNPGLVLRAASPNKNMRKCDRCRRQCKPMMIHDRKDCTKCNRCPPGTHPDRVQKKCLRDNKDDKKKKFEDKLDREKRDYNFKKNYHKFRPKPLRFLRKVSVERKKYKELQDIKRDAINRMKVRRLGKCALLTPLAISGEAIEKYSTGFFDENFMDSMELLGLWPEELKIFDPKYLDQSVFTDEYLDKYVDFAQEHYTKRSIDNAAPEDQQDEDKQEMGLIISPSSQELSIRSIGAVDINRRCPFCIFVVIARAIGAAVARAAARAASRAASAGARVSKILDNIAKNLKLTKGKGNKTYREQKDAAREISKNRNWPRCLRGNNPK